MVEVQIGIGLAKCLGTRLDRRKNGEVEREKVVELKSVVRVVHARVPSNHRDCIQSCLRDVLEAKGAKARSRPFAFVCRSFLTKKIFRVRPIARRRSPYQSGYETKASGTL